MGIDFKKLVDNSLEPMILIDRLGRILFVNRAMRSRFGRSRRELLGHFALEFIPLADWRAARKILASVASGYKARELVLEVKTKRGSPVTMVFSAKPAREGKRLVGFVVNGRDITRQAAAEKALRESEHELKAVFEGSHDAIFVADTGTRALIACNKKAEELIGYSRKRILSMRADQLHPRDMAKATMAGFREQALGRKLILETEVLTKGGRRIPVDVSTGLAIVAGRKAMVGVFRDVTERKKAEDELRVSFERLKALDGMKSDFVANVSHELRTPLTTLMLGFELMKTKPETRQEVSGMLERNAARLQDTVSRILEFSALDAGKQFISRRRMDMAALAVEVAEDARSRVEAKGLSLSVGVPVGLALSGDRRALSRVLSNLLDNAIKFTESGSIDVSASREKGYILVRVRDTGRGIQKKDLPRLFEKFVKLEKHTPGSGIGLWVCKKIVGAHGGRIWVESRQGKGTTVSFTIPTGGRK